MKNWKQIFGFALAMMLPAAVGGWFVAFYQLDLYGEAMREELAAQLGSTTVFAAICVVQAAAYAFVCALLGRILAEKTGLWKPLRLERRPLLVTIAVSVAFGILFSLDYWIFGAVIPEEYGGLGLPVTTYAKIVEAVSAVWMSLSGIFNSHLIMSAAVTRFGTDAQKREWLPKFATGEIRGGLAAELGLRAGYRVPALAQDKIYHLMDKAGASR